MDTAIVIMTTTLAAFFCLISLSWLHGFFKESKNDVSQLVLKKLKEKMRAKQTTPARLFSEIDETISIWFEFEAGKNNSEINLVIAGIVMVLSAMGYSVMQ